MAVSNAKWARTKKLITSLRLKKYRKLEQCFVVEGAKSVLELLDSDFEISMLLGTPAFLDENKLSRDVETLTVSQRKLESIGEFKTNDTVMAVARMKANTPFTISDNEFVIMLDDVRDPGNLGTIIRTADWFGINKIIASEETADMYNSKVITSTMGSFVRVFGTYLDGNDVHGQQFGVSGLILIGNESRGISKELEPFVTDKITIPRYGSAESLNAAIATAVICDNLRRH
jgi:TrmH family RNA methyltransferase